MFNTCSYSFIKEIICINFNDKLSTLCETQRDLDYIDKYFKVFLILKLRNLIALLSKYLYILNKL